MQKLKSLNESNHSIVNLQLDFWQVNLDFKYDTWFVKKIEPQKIL